ncbi:MAG: hypothetical protein RJA99_2421 [Pseudomonadota bacterium]
MFRAFDAASWKRAQIVAAVHSRGLTDLTAEDLLQEAVTALLGGVRTFPADVPPLVVLGNAMRSIASNARSRDAASPVDGKVEVDPFETSDDDHTGSSTVSTMTITPEDQVRGKQEIAAIYAALAGDEDLQMLVMAWADGLRGEEARKELGWDAKKYDADRKRLIRRLEQLDPERSRK